MALGDDLLKKSSSSGDMATGFALGVGVALLAPVALVAMSGLGRPAGRAARKAGILFFEKGRETVAELGEVLDDLIAEARYELRQSGGEQDTPAQGAASSADPAKPPEPE